MNNNNNIFDPRSPSYKIKRSPFKSKVKLDPRSPSIKMRTPIKDICTTTTTTTTTTSTSTTISFIDPRSPSMKIKRSPINKTQMSQNVFDPRSPSMKLKRSPIQKILTNTLTFDPRSPSMKFKRSPIQKNSTNNTLLFDPRSPNLKKRTPISLRNKRINNSFLDPRSPSIKRLSPQQQHQLIETKENEIQETIEVTPMKPSTTNQANREEEEDLNSIIQKDLNGEFIDSILSDNFGQLKLANEITNSDNSITKEISRSSEILKPTVNGTPSRLSKLQKSKDQFRSSPSLSSPKRVSLSGLHQNRMSPMNSSKTSPSTSNRNSKVMSNQQENINLLNIFVNEQTTTVLTPKKQLSHNNLNGIISQPLTPKLTPKITHREPLSPVRTQKKIHHPRTPSQLIL
ncbi:hypothetical protein DLAC_10438 [Tieghemostelium lacteum]|uniref:Uncharacterized protein n=1 Tax=Tieghemostelium lacteum TaxID=361077 RepID=A0A151Z5W8_TIELA|nr:hypothetical protein DLAC_10438 [Tieghemostelium lacteum]|eukprot:KYQ89194.1 hypothetical protein DLAC_10438 [Tieghemostelium lacteum]